MGTVRLREPEYDPYSADLDLAFWKGELRDAFGRWTKGGSARANDRIAKEIEDETAWRTAVATANKGASYKLITSGDNTARSAVEAPARPLSKGEARKALTLDHEHRQILLDAAGLRGDPAYANVADSDLIHRVAETNDPKEKARLSKELLTRQQMLASALSTAQAAGEEAQRAARRTFYEKFDSSLRKTKMGRALILVRNGMMADPTLDEEGKLKEKGRDKFKEYLHELATGRLVKVLASSAVGLAAHLISSSPDLPEKLHHIAEMQPVEAGLVVLSSAAVSLATASIKKHGAKVAKKAVEKVKLKEAP